MADQQFVEDNAKHVQVRAAVEWQSERLPGGVFRCANERADNGQARVALQQLGDAEVRQKRAVTGQEDVVGLDARWMTPC